MVPGVLACAGSSRPWRLGGGHARGGRQDGIFIWDEVEVLVDVHMRSRLGMKVRTGGVMENPAWKNTGNPQRTVRVGPLGGRWWEQSPYSNAYGSQAGALGEQ